MEQQECNVRKHLAGKRVYCKCWTCENRAISVLPAKGGGGAHLCSCLVSVEVGECSEDENIHRND